MSEKVIIVNTHPFENPEFVDKLVDFMVSMDIVPEVIEGYDDENPLDLSPACIFLTGVPADAEYSLSEVATQITVEKAFHWVRDCHCPIMGICYGHQILAHIFGGKVATLKKMIRDEQFLLTWDADKNSGIFTGIDRLVVFAEHRDYVAKVPIGFKALCYVNQIPYIMHHLEREMYGLQFVPEQSDEKSKTLLQRFVGTSLGLDFAQQ